MRQSVAILRAGDIVLAQVPAEGNEKKSGDGRPWVVLGTYNGQSGTFLAAPLTTNSSEFPGRVPLSRQDAQDLAYDSWADTLHVRSLSPHRVKAIIGIAAQEFVDRARRELVRVWGLLPQ